MIINILSLHKIDAISLNKSPIPVPRTIGPRGGGGAARRFIILHIMDIIDHIIEERGRGGEGRPMNIDVYIF